MHAGGVGAGGVALPACDTVNERFATEIVPVRAAPVFAATTNVTAPFPRPGEPEVTVIHGALLTAVQSQTPCDSTEIVPDPPPAGTF